MISAFKGHFSFLYSKKINIITFGLIGLTLILNIYFSNIFSDYSEIMFNRQSYLDTFLFDSYSIMKIIFILYILMNVLYSFILSDYDIFFLTRVSRIKTVMSKAIITLLINIFFGTVIYLLFAIIWSLTPYDIDVNSLLVIYLRVVLFICYYSLLNILLVVMYKHIYILMIPFVGYLISSFSLEYGVDFQSQNHFSKSINFLFPDLIDFNHTFSYMYGDVFIMGMIIIFTFGIIRRYSEKDIK